jgi:hypothetical protein
VSTLTFALAWLRVSDLEHSSQVVLDSLYVGIIILILSSLVGFPVAYLVARYNQVRWWLSACLASIAGAAFAAIYADSKPDGFTSFSPWHRDHPGFIDSGDPPITLGDYVGSIAFGAIVGAAFGLAFWYVYRRMTGTPARD